MKKVTKNLESVKNSFFIENAIKNQRKILGGYGVCSASNARTKDVDCITIKP